MFQHLAQHLHLLPLCLYCRRYFCTLCVWGSLRRMRTIAQSRRSGDAAGFSRAHPFQSLLPPPTPPFSHTALPRRGLQEQSPVQEGGRGCSQGGESPPLVRRGCPCKCGGSGRLPLSPPPVPHPQPNTTKHNRRHHHQEAAAKKLEAKRLADEEEAAILKSKPKPGKVAGPKVTRHELNLTREQEEAAAAEALKQRQLAAKREVDEASYSRLVETENVNRCGGAGAALLGVGVGEECVRGCGMWFCSWCCQKVG